jgi:hypothetical protein
MHRLATWPLVAMVVSLFSAGASAAPTRFYLSPEGNDAWSGTLAAPNAQRTDGPWVTLAHARDTVRKLRARQAPSEPVEILLRSGRYELPGPLVLGPDDSGTEKSPTIWTAYPAERPVISGGRRIGPWKVSANGEWVAEVPEARSKGWVFRHVAVNGQWRDRPRLPRSGHFRIAGLAGADPRGRYDTRANRFEYAAGDIDPKWTSLSDVEVVVLHFWVDTHLKIAQVDPDRRLVTFDRFSRRKFTDDYKPELARYYVSNVYEALGPGDFYLTRATARLHYRPKEGESPEKTEVVAPRLSALVQLQGDPGAGKIVEHVVFRNLTFSDTAYEPGPQDAVDGQAASTVPGAIMATGARSCSIEGCLLRNLGGYGIELSDGCQGLRIVHNELTGIGAGGIKMTGGTARSPEARRTRDNVVTDNHMHDLGRSFHSGVGILIMHAAGNTLAYNHIHDLYYTGISVGWVWGYGPSVSRENRIEFNHIHHVGRKLLSDMGGVYLLGVSPGTVVRNNKIHDVEAWGYGGWGLYTDEGSTGIVLENNLVYRTTHGGFHQHYGRENIVRNNIFALARDAQVVRTRMEPHRSFTFERNIVYYRTGNLLGSNWKDDKFAMDYNLYFNTAGKPVEFPDGSLEKWQARGFDKHSLVADPLFVAPERDDFSLRPDSPALKLGFKPLDMSRVGPRERKEP